MENNEPFKMAGSVIFKLVGGICIALVTFITAVGAAIFGAIENPTGQGKTPGIIDSLVCMFKNLFKDKKTKKGGK